jgi:DNA repair exonuclease SbcCD ATPase subunit
MTTEKEQEKQREVDTQGEEKARLRQENEALNASLQERDTRMIALEQNRAARESENAALKQELEDARHAMDGLSQVVARTIDTYKEAVIHANPGLPAEMISGATVEDINESVGKARAILQRVRQEMEAEAARTRVPAGAPPRALPDLSALSAREKIQYGLGAGVK